MDTPFGQNQDLRVGMSASIAKAVTLEDVQMFAQVTGDTNPLHLDEAVAAKSVFKERVAHGMLSAGLISAVLGTKLPGPGAIYLAQTLRFKAPVRIGATVTANAEITALDTGRNRVVLRTTCLVDGTPVLEGEATLLLPVRS